MKYLVEVEIKPCLAFGDKETATYHYLVNACSCYEAENTAISLAEVDIANNKIQAPISPMGKARVIKKIA